ncbi:MAG TPA: FKBP-type peptidyl-prolyl cis-trans isomerase [Caldilineaceae bacterium]|nr:FKBP-type peptidyl-prolyl cis-trans isomerase [Caldilineaceae bacterium]
MPRLSAQPSRLPAPLLTLCLMLLSLMLLAACGRERIEPAATQAAAAESAVAAAETQAATVQPTPTGETAEAPATPTQSDASRTLFDPEKTVTTASGLQYTEVIAGTGPKPQPGEVVAVHYTGSLTDGAVFDSSYDRGEPIRFALGTGMVIPGWNEGIAMMNQGGQAILVIPPALAYGEEGYPGLIPPNATLIFDVELVEISPGAPNAPTAVDESAYLTTTHGITYADLVVGDGPSPMPGQLVVVHYTGWLAEGGKFDSSLDRGQPYEFNLGMGQVIAGWDLGMAGMKVGGKRQLIIPPHLAYGEQGAGGVIPPNATLIFEIELLEVR